MNTQDAIKLYRYNAWANRRLLDSASNLSSEQLTHDLGGSFPTVRAVIAHMVLTEWVWFQRWAGKNPPGPPDWAGADLPDLISRLRDLERDRAEFLAGLSDEQLSSRIDFTYLSGAVGSHELQDLLIHVVNHGTFHRGQLTSMIRQLGVAPRSTDFVVFRAEEPT
ncbi:MAG: DinB family protein [Gemmatimonadales bacterium]